MKERVGICEAILSSRLRSFLSSGKLTIFPHDVAELEDEIVVLLSAKTRATQTEVKRIVEQLLVVRSDIEDDGEDAKRVDTRSNGVLE